MRGDEEGILLRLPAGIANPRGPGWVQSVLESRRQSRVLDDAN